MRWNGIILTGRYGNAVTIYLHLQDNVISLNAATTNEGHPYLVTFTTGSRGGESKAPIDGYRSVHTLLCNMLLLIDADCIGDFTLMQVCLCPCFDELLIPDSG